MSIPVRRDCTYEPLSDLNSGDAVHTHVDCDETPQQSGLHTYAPECGKGNKIIIPNFLYYFLNAIFQSAEALYPI